MKHPSLALLALVCTLAGAAEPAFRHAAPVTVQQPAPFVQLPLPASTYARSVQPGLADLRVVDARGERVPFALLPAPEAVLRNDEQLRDTTAYPLPKRSAPGAALASPVEVLVQGDTLRVRRSPGAAARPAADSPGWLFDLGERRRDEAAPQALRLAWSGPDEFGAAFDIDTSDTLRDWRAGGSGQLLALRAAAGPLVQREVPLPPDCPRFVRLVWREAATAPALTGAQAVTLRVSAHAADETTTLTLSPEPEPEPPGTPAPPKGALHFDLGGALPVSALDLQLPPGTRVAPVRLQGRARADGPWQELGSAVFYRIERDGAASLSPPWALSATLRFLRVLPDERSAALDPAATKLVVKARLARLLLATQGTPPYRLLAGSPDAPAGALPISTLVPALDAERPRFGRAELGAWAEDAESARQAAAAAQRAALRPVVLWAVLLAGVGLLGFMVWKLARGKPAAPV